MKFSTSTLLAAVLAAATGSVSAAPSRFLRTRAVDAALIPDFGVVAGTPKADSPGSCEGVDGQAIPCTCPPSKDVVVDKLTKFLEVGLVGSGSKAISFPTGDSPEDQSTRIDAVLATLRNIEMSPSDVTTTSNAAKRPPTGCPSFSTTLVAQQKALKA